MATGIIVALNPLVQLQKASDARRKSDLKQIQNALEAYYSDHQAYPISECISSPGVPRWDCWLENKEAFMMSPNGTNYIKKMPIDPRVKDNGNACSLPGDMSRLYGYYSSTGQSYLLVTRLENLSDPSIQPGSPNYYDGKGGGCTGFANYKIQVP